MATRSALSLPRAAGGGFRRSSFSRQVAADVGLYFEQRARIALCARIKTSVAVRDVGSQRPQYRTYRDCWLQADHFLSLGLETRRGASTRRLRVRGRPHMVNAGCWGPLTPPTRLLSPRRPISCGRSLGSGACGITAKSRFSPAVAHRDQFCNSLAACRPHPPMRRGATPGASKRSSSPTLPRWQRNRRQTGLGPPRLRADSPVGAVRLRQGANPPAPVRQQHGQMSIRISVRRQPGTSNPLPWDAT